MPSTDIAEIATCTTCSYDDDRSNYWTSNLFFRARNGSFKRVPQAPNRYVRGNWKTGCKFSDTGRLLFDDHFTTKTKGGLVVYYVSPGKGKVKSFLPVRAVLSRVVDADLVVLTVMFRGRASACSQATPARERWDRPA